MGSRSVQDRTSVWGQAGAGARLLQTHLSIRAGLLEHPVDRERKSGRAHPTRVRLLQAIPWQARGQGPRVLFRHRASLESKHDVWHNWISPPPTPAHLNLPYCHHSSCGIWPWPFGLIFTQQAEGVSKEMLDHTIHLLKILPAQAEKSLRVCGLPCLLCPWASPSTLPHPSIHISSLLFFKHTRVGPASRPLLSQSPPPEMLPTTDLLASPTQFCDGAPLWPHLLPPLLPRLYFLSHSTPGLLTYYTSNLLIYACLLC